MKDVYVNPRVRQVIDSASSGSPRAFHQRLPGYVPSKLTAMPTTAQELGIAELWVKEESARMGLPSFKILGASWATFKALEQAAGHSLDDWDSMSALGQLAMTQTPVRRIATATDGNHGRAVARIARWLGLNADIFVPTGTAAARIDAIISEGASVEVVAGSYLAAVERSAREASHSCLVISDTSWGGYEDVPGWVIDGYSTIFSEVFEQMSDSGADLPTTVVVQIGVGALAAAVVRHFRRAGGPAVSILGVEPDSAACVVKSMRSGTLESVPGPHPSIMAGLNCDTPSIVAWPDISEGIDALVSIDDGEVRDGMRRLAMGGIESGETGAAGFTGLVAAASEPSLRDALGLHSGSRVLVLSTEGATDPEAYEQIVGKPAKSMSVSGS